MGWIIASLFFYYCAYLTIAETTGIGDEKPLVLLFFLVVATILLIVFIRKTVNSVREKRRDEEEEARKKEKEEQYRTQAQKRKENFRNRLPSNIIITDVVPQVGKKWATELIEEFKSYTYMKRSLHVQVFDDHISIGSTRINFNQYGLKNLYDDDCMDVYSAVISALEASVNAELKARVNTHFFVYSEYEHSYTLPYGFIKCTLGIDTRQSW